jgi:hypothetical protein
MAKDKGGHGSEKRGAAGLAAAKAASDQTRRAFTNKYGATGGTMASRDAGGHRYGYTSPADIKKINDTIAAGHLADNKQAADMLAQGHPKSAQVETHPSMAGGKSVVPPEVAASFARQRAEAGKFRSGAREINRLRSQGK